MIDILSYLPGKHKTTTSGWTSFNAQCCQHNGQGKDIKGRGGIKETNNGWVYHCFNCNYTASFVLGQPLSVRLRKLLSWLNVDEHDIDILNLESLKHRSLADLIPKKVEKKVISFDDKPLPDTAEVITNDVKFKLYTDYLKSRGLTVDDYPFMVNTANTRPGIMIPYTYHNRTVGHTVRFLDNRRPRYLSDQQPNFVFGIDLQKEDWSFAIVVEGVLDAISINGIGLLHNEISNEQARILKSLHRKIIVVPDQDFAGVALIDRAVELGFSVSIPQWESCKDVNDAVKKYGKLATLLSIIQSKESSTIKINLKKRQLIRKLGECND